MYFFIIQYFVWFQAEYMASKSPELSIRRIGDVIFQREVYGFWPHEYGIRGIHHLFIVKRLQSTFIYRLVNS